MYVTLAFACKPSRPEYRDALRKLSMYIPMPYLATATFRISYGSGSSKEAGLPAASKPIDLLEVWRPMHCLVTHAELRISPAHGAAVEHADGALLRDGTAGPSG